MHKERPDPAEHQPGDKVRVRAGPYAGARGVVRSIADTTLSLQTGTGQTVYVPHEHITNYSLAARRAWQAMPKRAGRPRSPNPPKKMVSMRLDVDTWRRLGEAAERGLIPSREQAVNAWLRERLTALFGEGPPQGET